MIVIIKDTRINQERQIKMISIVGNIQEFRFLATCLAKGGSQCWLGLLSTIQHACHSGSHISGRFEKKLR